MRVFFLSAVFFLTAPAWAQTPMPAKDLPPPPALESAPDAPEAVAVPVSPDRVEQAKRQHVGDFDQLNRTGRGRMWVGGQIQEAWNNSIDTDGVYMATQCQDCTYKIRLREHMVTSIVLPAQTKITSFDIGDQENFQVRQRGDNILTLLPRRFGTDSSLLVYGEDGTVWPFYLWAEGVNSENVPDLKVVIRGQSKLAEQPIPLVPQEVKTTEVQEKKPKSPQQQAALKELAAATADEPESKPADDFIQNAPIDPDKFHGWDDYELWGDEDSLKPATIFRDDHFTYIQFGDRWKDVELPTAYVVVDGFDEVVNTRVQGRTYIVESTRPLITLKSGGSYLCIKYTGGKS